MYQQAGTNGFTTMVVEPTENGTTTAGVWQTLTLSDATMVWQTNQTDPLLPHRSAVCTYADFKAHYQEAHIVGLQVAIGSGVPGVTSYADGASITVDGATDTWNFELAVKATPRPTKTPTVTTPPTDTAPLDNPPSFDGRVFIILGAAAAHRAAADPSQGVASAPLILDPRA